MPEIEQDVRRKECPLCCESMRVRTRELTERIPGLSQTVKHVVKQWECKDCSYEEDLEEDQ